MNALCYVQPGVASVHASILQKSSESASFYLRDMPQLHGMTFGAIRRRFSTAIACGYYCGDKSLPHFNPADSWRYSPEDKLIFLANKGQPPCLGLLWLLNTRATCCRAAFSEDRCALQHPLASVLRLSTDTNAVSAPCITLLKTYTHIFMD